MSLFCRRCQIKCFDRISFSGLLQTVCAYRSDKANLCFNNNSTVLSLTESRTLSASKNKSALLKKDSNDICRQFRRPFSTDRDGDGSTPPIKGAVFSIPNPINWVKNKLASMYIRSSVDPQFSLEEFRTGAIQAVNYFFRLLASNQTEELEQVATKEVIAEASKFVASLSPFQQSNLDFKADNASFFSCNFHSVNTDEQGGKLVAIDLFLAVLKPYDAGVHVYQGTLRFSRRYQGDTAGSWVITNVDLQVQDIKKGN